MRCYFILKALTERREYLPISYFMSELNVSKRTVQNDIRYLKESGNIHGYELKNMYGKGYFLEIKNQLSFSNFVSELNCDSHILSDKNIIFEEIYFLLIYNGKFVTVDEISGHLQISKTAVFEKMEILSKYLKSYNLYLKRRSHYGIRIEGNENNKRRLMFDLYMSPNNSVKKFVDQRIGNFVEVERLTEDCIQENNLRVGYYEFQQIIAWIKVLIVFVKNVQRPLSDNNFFEDKKQESLLNVNDFLKILARVSLIFKINFSSQQCAEFVQMVSNLVQDEREKINLISSKELNDALMMFLKKVDDENKTDFSEDQDFIDQLEKHLLLLVGRLDQKVKFKNPMLIELCIKYPLIFDIVLKFSTFFTKRFGYRISVDELAFIAVHFLGHSESNKVKKIERYKKVAVICTTGGGVGNLIRNQIQTIFPNSSVKAYPFWQKEEIEKFNPGIVFSAVPLQESLNIPVIYINELLSSKDLENIRQFLFLNDLGPKDVFLPDVSKEYLKLFDPLCFSVTSKTDYKEIIKQMGQDLVKKGYGNKKLVDNILLREKYMSTVFKNGIAMPHPIEMNATRSVISVRVVKPEIYENKKKVKLVFLVYLAKNSVKYYNQISNALFQLMKNDNRINKVYQRELFQELMKTLSEMEA